MLDILHIKNEKKPVYRWELDVVEKWETETIRNRIWTAKECGQPIPGCVSVEALRLELVRRGESPNGYHESADDVDMTQIIVEEDLPRRRKGR